MIKLCGSCGEEKEHGKNKSRADGLQGQCKDCRKMYRDNNKEKVAAQKRTSYLKNKEHYNARSARYYQENREDCLKQQKVYVELNRHKVNAKNSYRRRTLRNQIPQLTAEEQQRIQDLYWLARDLRAVSGQDYHVDHIIPISRGGLHHPDNLQILPADINLSKGAKHPPIPQGLNTKVKDL